jgi:hypothetical protein
MAYVDVDQNKLANGEDPQAQGSSDQAGSSGQSAFAGSASGPDVNPQGTTGAQGTGGQSHWTNIQDYLSANKGQSKTADQLGNYVNGYVDKEQNSLNDSANQAKQGAQSEVGKVDYSQDQASKLLQDASQAGQGSDAYNQNTGTLKGALSARYGGPTQYSYGYSNDYSNVKNDLNNNFQGLVDNVYGNASSQNGGPSSLSRGQLDLQHQLDLDSGEQIDAAKQAAMAKMAGFETGAGQTIQDTAQNVADAQNQFIQKQQGLQSYLNQGLSSDRQQLQGLADQWNQAEVGIKNSAPTNSNYLHYEFGNPSAGTGEWQHIDQNQFTGYQPGGSADVSNVTGGDPYRGHFNTIADILGQQAIASGSPIAHGSVTTDAQALQNAIANMYASEQARGMTENSKHGGLDDSHMSAWQSGNPYEGDVIGQFDPRSPYLGVKTSRGVF